MFDKRIIKKFQKINNVLIGSTNGGRNNQVINFISNGATISGKCFGDVKAGNALALQDDLGQWYLIGEESGYSRVTTQQGSSRQVEYKKTRKPKKTQAVNGFVMWLDCNWLQYSELDNIKFLRELLEIFDIENISTIYTQNRSRVLIERNSFGILPNAGAAPLPLLSSAVSGKEIIEIDFSTTEPASIANGLLIVCLEQPFTDNVFKEAELKFLREVALNYAGVVILGEWRSWTFYNNVILSTLSNKRIQNRGSFDTYQWLVPHNSRFNISERNVRTNATNVFVGSLEEENLAFEISSGLPSVIYVAPENM